MGCIDHLLGLSKIGCERFLTNNGNTTAYQLQNNFPMRFRPGDDVYEVRLLGVEHAPIGAVDLLDAKLAGTLAGSFFLGIADRQDLGALYPLPAFEMKFGDGPTTNDGTFHRILLGRPRLRKSGEK